VGSDSVFLCDGWLETSTAAVKPRFFKAIILFISWISQAVLS